jgi:hypothetical protein
VSPWSRHGHHPASPGGAALSRPDRVPCRPIRALCRHRLRSRGSCPWPVTGAPPGLTRRCRPNVQGLTLLANHRRPSGGVRRYALLSRAHALATDGRPSGATTAQTILRARRRYNSANNPSARSRNASTARPGGRTPRWSRRSGYEPSLHPDKRGRRGTARSRDERALHPGKRGWGRTPVVAQIQRG